MLKSYFKHSESAHTWKWVLAHAKFLASRHKRYLNVISGTWKWVFAHALSDTGVPRRKRRREGARAIHHPVRDVLCRAIFICRFCCTFSLYISILFTRYCSPGRCNVVTRALRVCTTACEEDVSPFRERHEKRECLRGRARAADRPNLRDGRSRTRSEWQIIFPPPVSPGSPDCSVVMRARIRPRNRQAIHQDIADPTPTAILIRSAGPFELFGAPHASSAQKKCPIRFRYKNLYRAYWILTRKSLSVLVRESHGIEKKTRNEKYSFFFSYPSYALTAAWGCASRQYNV